MLERLVTDVALQVRLVLTGVDSPVLFEVGAPGEDPDAFRASERCAVRVVALLVRGQFVDTVEHTATDVALHLGVRIPVAFHLQTG